MAAEDPTKERFEILRRRAQQAARQATQQEAEGLKRRFAQIGQVGSGAQIRAEAQAAERGAQRLARAEETVGLAELAERQRQRELGEAREFARGEREAGQRFAAEQAGVGREFAAEQARQAREFGAGQAELQRKFVTGERLGAQDFARLEAATGRAFSREERQSAQRFADAQAALSRSFTGEQNQLMRNLQQAGLDLQRQSFDENTRRFDLEFARDSDTIAFNKRMALDNASKGLLDDLGLGGINAESIFGKTSGEQIGTIFGGLAGLPLGPMGAVAGGAVGRAIGGLF